MVIIVSCSFNPSTLEVEAGGSVIVLYTLSWRPTWATGDPPPSQKNEDTQCVTPPELHKRVLRHGQWDFNTPSLRLLWLLPEGCTALACARWKLLQSVGDVPL